MRPAALEMEYFCTLHKLAATRTFGGQQRPRLCAAQSYGGTLGSTSKVRGGELSSKVGSSTALPVILEEFPRRGLLDNFGPHPDSKRAAYSRSVHGRHGGAMLSTRLSTCLHIGSKFLYIRFNAH